MTFIASVIATEGVAIVADSFVTSSTRSIGLDDFKEYLETIKDDLKGKKATLRLEDVAKLFKEQPGYTRDYADKLIQYDKFTAITSTGHAYINKKLIKEIIKQIKHDWEQVDHSIAGNENTIENKINFIIEKLNEEVKDHINGSPFESIENSVFILSHYNQTISTAQVFKITINQTTKKELESGKTELISYRDESMFKVITDGQDFIIDRFLFGSMYRYETIACVQVATKILSELKAKPKTREKIMSLIKTERIIERLTNNDLKLVDLRPLSLQEAVNLASLLMRIVKDIQVYTQKIPTVGGLVKLATIDDSGFKFISGDAIITPNLVY